MSDAVAAVIGTECADVAVALSSYEERNGKHGTASELLGPGGESQSRRRTRARVTELPLTAYRRVTYSQFLTVSRRSAFTLSRPAPQSIESRVLSRAVIVSSPPFVGAPPTRVTPARRLDRTRANCA